MAQSSILLTGGTVILHEADDSIVTKKADILIQGNTIAKIESSISAPSPHTRVIDCKDHIISPGFIDTHRHTWQTQLKGRHLDQSLIEYLATGNMLSAFYTPEDIFWGTLGGALESIDAGTTTIIGHEHMTYSEANVRQGLAGFEASGVRATFCATPINRVKSWEPKLEIDHNPLPDWWEPMFWSLAEKQPWADGRVRLGLAFDSWQLPKDKIQEIFARARSSGIKLFTGHVGACPHGAGVLGPDWVLSHANGYNAEQAATIVKSGAHVSSTPSTELQMLGDPVCFRSDLGPVSGLGVDCHSATSASLMTEARLALQHERSLRNAHFFATNAHGFPSHIDPDLTAAHAFNLATMGGARAVGLADVIGSLAPGKRADLVIWDATSPATVAAAQEDPVAAIIAHSSVRDVAAVIVDGVLRKEAGRLLPVALPDGRSVAWPDVARELLRSREELRAKFLTIDVSTVKKAFGF